MITNKKRFEPLPMKAMQGSQEDTKVVPPMRSTTRLPSRLPRPAMTQSSGQRIRSAARCRLIGVYAGSLLFKLVLR